MLLSLSDLFRLRSAEARLAIRLCAALLVLRRSHGDMLVPRNLLPELRGLLGNRRLTAREVAAAVDLLCERGLVAVTRAPGIGRCITFREPDHAPLAARLASIGRRGRILWHVPIRVEFGQLADIARARAPGRISSLLAHLPRLEFDADATGRCSVALIRCVSGLSRRAVQRGTAALCRDELMTRLPSDPKSGHFWQSGGLRQLGPRHVPPRTARRRRGELAAKMRDAAPLLDELKPPIPQNLPPPSSKKQSSCAGRARGASAPPKARARGVACAAGAERRAAKTRAQPAPAPAKPAARRTWAMGRSVRAQRAPRAAAAWRDLAPAELADQVLLLGATAQAAVARGWVPRGPYGKRMVLAAAEFALRRGKCPGAYFTATLQRGAAWPAELDHERARARWLAREARGLATGAAPVAIGPHTVAQALAALRGPQPRLGDPRRAADDRIEREPHAPGREVGALRERVPHRELPRAADPQSARVVKRRIDPPPEHLVAAQDRSQNDGGDKLVKRLQPLEQLAREHELGDHDAATVTANGHLTFGGEKGPAVTLDSATLLTPPKIPIGCHGARSLPLAVASDDTDRMLSRAEAAAMMDRLMAGVGRRAG